MRAAGTGTSGGIYSAAPATTGTGTATAQGLTFLSWNIKQMNLKSLSRSRREVSERKQVGDAESMVNEGRDASGRQGLFGGDGGEV